jgi:hypothetical protein
MAWTPHRRIGLIGTICLACLAVALHDVRLTAQDSTPVRPKTASESTSVENSLLPGARESASAETANPFEDRIETDRDSFTPSTKTTGRGLFILESSFTFEDNRHTPETYSFPELLVRYGLTDRIELRLGWNYEVGGGSDSVSGDEGPQDVPGGGIHNEARMLYGLKVQTTKQEDWVPESCVILQGITPTAGENTATQILAAYVLGWELPRKWRLDGSIRYGTESESHDRFEVWAPSVVLRVPLSERINVHAEYFGLFSQEKENEFCQQFFSPGIHYLVTPNVEVGVRVGWGLNEQSTRFFSNVGFGWRF